MHPQYIYIYNLHTFEYDIYIYIYIYSYFICTECAEEQQVGYSIQLIELSIICCSVNVICMP